MPEELLDLITDFGGIEMRIALGRPKRLHVDSDHRLRISNALSYRCWKVGLSSFQKLLVPYNGKERPMSLIVSMVPVRMTAKEWLQYTELWNETTMGTWRSYLFRCPLSGRTRRRPDWCLHDYTDKYLTLGGGETGFKIIGSTSGRWLCTIM
jgi:hypothetical protein